MHFSVIAPFFLNSGLVVWRYIRKILPLRVATPYTFGYFFADQLFQIVSNLQDSYSRYGWQSITRSLGAAFEAGIEGKVS